MAKKKVVKKKEERTQKKAIEPLNTNVLFIVYNQDEFIAPHQEHIKVNVLSHLKEVSRTHTGVAPDLTFYTIYVSPKQIEESTPIDDILASAGYSRGKIDIYCFIDNPILLVSEGGNKIAKKPALPVSSFKKAVWFLSILASDQDVAYGLFVGSPLFARVFGDPKHKIYSASFLYVLPAIIGNNLYFQTIKDIISLLELEEEKKEVKEESRKESEEEFKVYGGKLEA